MHYSMAGSTIAGVEATIAGLGATIGGVGATIAGVGATIAGVVREVLYEWVVLELSCNK